MGVFYCLNVRIVFSSSANDVGTDGVAGPAADDQEVEFPHMELARLDEMINRPRWVVPVLHNGELEILLDASIALCKKGWCSFMSVNGLKFCNPLTLNEHRFVVLLRYAKYCFRSINDTINQNYRDKRYDTIIL